MPSLKLDTKQFVIWQFLWQPSCLLKEAIVKYHIAGKFGREKAWRIDSLGTFGERKFDELVDQPIGYY